MTKIEKPKVGTWIRVQTDYSEAKKTFHWLNPRKFETVGKVVESQEWENENSFALLTTDPRMRIKTIELKYVVSIEVIEAGVVQEVTNNSFDSLLKEESSTARTFDIEGSKGNIYVVTKDKFSWSCTCVAGLRGRRCKHVDEAEAKFKAEPV